MKHLKLFVVSHQKSEFGVEWMRFEVDAAIPDLVRRVAHVAFEVTDLSSELAGREILIPPNSPSDGVRVARWLLFLRKGNGKLIVLDYYGNICRPIANAQEEIETLRQLKTIGDFGIVRGTVNGPGVFDRKVVPGARS